MSANVMDFTDLGKGIQFAYKGETYEIPSFTKSEMTALMEISDLLVAASKDVGKDIKEENKEDIIRSSEMKEMFRAQQQFIVAGVRKISQGVYTNLEINDIEAWPWKLCNKVVSLIQEMMSTISDVDGEKRKSNPTKEK
jgi:hypothetical protein